MRSSYNRSLLPTVAKSKAENISFCSGKTILCLGVFLGGWILGSFFVLSIVINDSNSSFIRNKLKDSSKELNTFVQKYVVSKDSKNTLITKEIMSQSLPTFALNETIHDDGDESIYIYTDWPVDDRLFTTENYKALESILTVYPTGIVRCLLPSSGDTFYHKTGNLLSYKQFTKYQKRGYDIEVFPVGNLKNKQNNGHLSLIGKSYWTRWSEKCCNGCNTICRNSDHTQPYHLLTFIRLTKLYPKGGIFSDFSFFFLGPFEPALVKQGYYINYLCSNMTLPINKMTEWQMEESKRGSYNINKYNQCVTSTLLVFNEPKSAAILCILLKYDDPIFIECIESDAIYGGAKCIYNAFKQCFEVHNINNDLVTNTAFNAEGKSKHSSSERVIEVFDHDPDNAAGKVLSASNWQMATTIRAFWYGSLAWQGLWHLLPYKNGTILNAAVETIHLKTNKYMNDDSCSVKCSHYSRNSELLSANNLPYSYNTGIEEASCAPTIVIGGFMKCASSFLFDALASHPQVLPPLKGSQYKEAKAYHPLPPIKFLKRAWSFPYVEDNENFAIADGTIFYGSNPHAPVLLKQDNPNVKVIFVIRHPVDRMYSNYKFAHETFKAKGGFDELIERGLARDLKFGLMRDMLVNGSSMEDIAHLYYNSSFNSGVLSSLGMLFMHSIPFPAIYYYRKVLGNSSVYVVNSDDLDVSNMDRIRVKLNNIFSFLGLCPYEIPDMKEKLNARNTLPPDKEMSQDMYIRLNAFFEPFNNMLSQLEPSINATEWNTRLPPRYLPMFTPGFNTTYFQPAWFIKEEILAEKKKGIIGHLLPKSDTESVASNTTLGIITMF